MAGEIQAVKEKIIQIVTSTIGSDSEPADYVLSLFSDPGNEIIINGYIIRGYLIDLNMQPQTPFPYQLLSVLINIYI